MPEEINSLPAVEIGDEAEVFVVADDHLARRNGRFRARVRSSGPPGPMPKHTASPLASRRFRTFGRLSEVFGGFLSNLPKV